jgi:hypothetical protein
MLKPWGFEEFRDMVAEEYGLDKELIDINTTLEEMDIDPEGFVQFLISKAGDFATYYGVELIREDNLDVEVRETRTLNYLVSNIFV